MNKDAIIEELRRVATLLNSKCVSRGAFARHATISTTAVEASFGSWNEGITAAGLTPLPQGGLPKAEQRRLERLSARPTGGSTGDPVSDDELLSELMKLAKQLGRRPSGNQVDAKGKYGRALYLRRWGTMAEAFKTAEQRRT